MEEKKTPLVSNVLDDVEEIKKLIIPGIQGFLITTLTNGLPEMLRDKATFEYFKKNQNNFRMRFVTYIPGVDDGLYNDLKEVNFFLHTKRGEKVWNVITYHDKPSVLETFNFVLSREKDILIYLKNEIKKAEKYFIERGFPFPPHILEKVRDDTYLIDRLRIHLPFLHTTDDGWVAEGVSMKDIDGNAFMKGFASLYRDLFERLSDEMYKKMLYYTYLDCLHNLALDREEYEKMSELDDNIPIEPDDRTELDEYLWGRYFR